MGFLSRLLDRSPAAEKAALIETETEPHQYYDYVSTRRAAPATRTHIVDGGKRNIRSPR